MNKLLDNNQHLSFQQYVNFFQNLLSHSLFKYCSTFTYSYYHNNTMTTVTILLQYYYMLVMHAAFTKVQLNKLITSSCTSLFNNPWYHLP